MWMNYSWHEGCVVCLNSRGSPAEEVQIFITVWTGHLLNVMQLNIRDLRRLNWKTHSDTHIHPSVWLLQLWLLSNFRKKGSHLRTWEWVNLNQTNSSHPPPEFLSLSMCSVWGVESVIQVGAIKHHRRLWSTFKMKDQETACGFDIHRREERCWSGEHTERPREFAFQTTTQFTLR